MTCINIKDSLYGYGYKDINFLQKNLQFILIYGIMQKVIKVM